MVGGDLLLLCWFVRGLGSGVIAVLRVWFVTLICCGLLVVGAAGCCFVLWFGWLLLIALGDWF